MANIKQIKAFLNLGDQKVAIGNMIQNQSKIYFKYDADFLKNGYEISPFKLKLSSAIVTPKEMHFEGLFGVFSDSIPDGWGKLLLDRKLQGLGRSVNEINALDRLSYIDKNSAGAISYEPEFVNDYSRNSIDLDQISQDIQKVINGTSEDVLEQLFQLGGSSGGARPKVNLGYNPKNHEIIYGLADLPADFEHWIIKFPSSSDFHDIALIEYLYNVMARNAGVHVNEFRLFKSFKGNYFFGSKRFDRIHNEKVHLHSVCGLLHDNFRRSTLDYGHIMDCAFQLEKNVSCYEKVLRLASFNVFAHNKDDHSKNFSFLMDTNGIWSLSPAYDLTFSNSTFGLHSTTVAGESKNPGIKELTKLANHFGVKNPNLIFDEVKNAISEFKILGNNLGISKDTMKLVNGSLKF